MKKKSEYKPLLFTATVRNPKRIKGLLNILEHFNNEVLTDELSEKIMGELIRCGLYRPMKQTNSIKLKWKSTRNGEFSNILLTDLEVRIMLVDNPQKHKEAGFNAGWSSRFVTIFDFAKELGFVYFWQNEKIEFSQIGLKLANSIKMDIKDDDILVSHPNPEFEQQAFLHALAKSQRNNPFVRVLNENIPLILLLEIIQKLNTSKRFNDSGISKLELPFVIFWKNSDIEELYQLIKSVRDRYGYNPSWEVIVDICENQIMRGQLKKFKPKSIMNEYPDEFIRKMRLTGLISLRGGGRFLDINKNELSKVTYVLENYSNYNKYDTERSYFDYMAKVDKNLITFTAKKISPQEKKLFLDKWVNIYSFDKIKSELLILSHKSLSKDNILKYLPNPVRLEFLTTLAIKSKFPNIRVVPNYPCDDEGIPTSTAGGSGDQGDIECFENEDGILVEVTMSEGRSQTVMEIWPIARHLEKFSQNLDRSMCYFVAPSIFKDSEMQIKFVKQENNQLIEPKTIQDFLNHLEHENKLYIN